MKGETKPKILLMADYSNFHSTLAKGLRELGCDVTVASDGVIFMNCERDIDIRRKSKSTAGGASYVASLLYNTLTKFRGYDIVSFRDPAFLDLKPERIIPFFNRIVKQNRSAFLSYISTDVPFLNMLEAQDSPLLYSEWFIDGKPNRLKLEDDKQWQSWHSPQMKALNDVFYSNIQGIVTGLYEYHKSAERIFPNERITYGGIPIDLEEIPYREVSNVDRVRIFLGRDNRRKLQKGSDIMEHAARKVVELFPDKAELVIVENVSRKEYLEAMRNSHVMLDQMYSYTPATMALEGLASGLTVVSGAEDDYYNFIGEDKNKPIINSPLDFDGLLDVISKLVLNRKEFAPRSRRGRAFVEKHNDKKVVAQRFMKGWGL